MPPLPDHEADEKGNRSREEAERLAGEPAVLTRLRDRVDERGEAAGHEHRAEGIEGLDARIPAFLEQDRGQDEGGHADRNVDEEDPRPAESGGEDPTEQPACGCPEAADRTPYPPAAVPLAAHHD